MFHFQRIRNDSPFDPLLPIFTSLISPLSYSAEARPYFTIHDSEFKEFTQRQQGAVPIILGVTNPFFSKTLQHWPHLIRLADNNNGMDFKNHPLLVSPFFNCHFFFPCFKSQAPRHCQVVRTVVPRIHQLRPSSKVCVNWKYLQNYWTRRRASTHSTNHFYKKIKTLYETCWPAWRSSDRPKYNWLYCGVIYSNWRKVSWFHSNAIWHRWCHCKRIYLHFVRLPHPITSSPTDFWQHSNNPDHIWRRHWKAIGADCTSDSFVRQISEIGTKADTKSSHKLCNIYKCKRSRMR